MRILRSALSALVLLILIDVPVDAREGVYGLLLPVAQTGCQPGGEALPTEPWEAGSQSITGCVTDRAGNPVRSIEVGIMPTDPERAMAAVPILIVEVGRYLFDPIYSGKYWVTVEAEDYKRATKVVTIGARGPTILDFVLERVEGDGKVTPGQLPEVGAGGMAGGAGPPRGNIALLISLLTARGYAAIARLKVLR